MKLVIDVDPDGQVYVQFETELHHRLITDRDRDCAPLRDTNYKELNTECRMKPGTRLTVPIDFNALRRYESANKSKDNADER